MESSKDWVAQIDPVVQPRPLHNTRRRQLPFGLQFVTNTSYTGYLPFLWIYVWWGLNCFISFHVVFLPRLAQGELPSSYTFLMLLYSFVATMCIVSLTRSVFSDPGVVSESYDEVITEKSHLTYCKNCTLYRPRRAHHCRHCAACIRKFDHHCPWINNCVGEDNRWLFVLLSWYATWHAGLNATLCFLYFYHLPEFTFPEETLDFSRRHADAIMGVDLVLTAVFAFVMFTQASAQMLYVRTDLASYQATVDKTFYNWINQYPAEDCSPSFSQLFGTRSKILWLLSPLRRHSPTRQLLFHYDINKPQPPVL